MGKESPIGIFDSGVGGLTVVKSLLERLPEESFIYFGDTANVPYGSKTEEQLMCYAGNILDFFIDKGVKAVVVACGTHSSVTLPRLEGQYDFPMLGVVKAAARSANRLSKNFRIGVMATQATVNSQAYTREITSINTKCQVFEAACHKFVPLIESGILDGEEIQGAIREYIVPLLDNGVDSLVLGCTHYPFLAPVIKEFAGCDIELVDPSFETIEELRETLARDNLINDSGNIPERQFYVSGNDESFYKVGRLLLGDMIKTVKRAVLD
ncbi:glutamate racemase [hydrocarbon metagenome]|uniref:glutamate racemase n=1 Tax=hydrocarbon metagenome TaxID=938273 RepID=A0A0W8E7B2_9ZZZZ